MAAETSPTPTTARELKARALAGDAAAMTRLAVEYYGALVPASLALDYVGAWP